MSYWLQITKVNEIYAKVSSNHPTLMNSLYTFMSVYAENFRFMPKYKAGLWDGKIHFMDHSGKFPIGLLRHVYRFVQQDGLSIEISEELLPKIDALEDEFNTITDEWISESITPRDYQLEGAIKICVYKRGILEHATSAGKSLTMALAVMYNLKKEFCSKVLIIVPSVGLVEQLTSDFIEFGVPEEWIGKFHGREKEIDKKITISTWQSMCRQEEYVKEFDMIVADECHGQKATVIRSIAENAINAKIRFGCTGTMPDDKSNRWLIEGLFGAVLHQVTPKYLIDHQYAADITVKIPFIMHPEEDVKKIKGMPYDEEKKWLETNEKRNIVISKIVDKHIQRDHNVLVLADHIDHIKDLYEKINELDTKNVFVVTGEVPAEKREKLRHFTNENKRVVIIATYGVFSTGISIKRLHSVIFASAGKSKIKTLQSVGRGMRLHKEKNGLILYDIGDNTYYSERHLKHRVDIYDKAEFKLDMVEIKL